MVEAADRLECDRARDDLQGVAVQREDEDPASFPITLIPLAICEVVLLDEVEAVFRKAKLLRPLPLTHDRAAVLPGEREDLQAVVVCVADEQLVRNHTQLLCAVEQP